MQIISIHALRVEGDAINAQTTAKSKKISIHALRVEGDLFHIHADLAQLVFLSTPSGWRATNEETKEYRKIMDFYPRPPGGGRLLTRSALSVPAVFLSTPSGWRATRRPARFPRRLSNFYPRPPGGGRLLKIFCFCLDFYFYPRPPGGGRLSHSMFPITAETISIHALRVEGDTNTTNNLNKKFNISIHALRVEGDAILCSLMDSASYFYPRPPGGGRLSRI